MNRETDSTIRQIEFELAKAKHGMGLPYDAERVGQLRHMLVDRVLTLGPRPRPFPARGRSQQEG